MLLRISQILRIDLLDERGFPLIIYDMKKRRIDKETLLSEKNVLKSAFLVAAIHGLTEGKRLTNIVTTENEKYLLLKRDKFVLVITLSQDADTTSEKLQLFARSLLYGVIEIHKRLGINPADLFLEDYLEIISDPFEKLVKKLIDRLKLV